MVHFKTFLFIKKKLFMYQQLQMLMQVLFICKHSMVPTGDFGVSCHDGSCKMY